MHICRGLIHAYNVGWLRLRRCSPACAMLPCRHAWYCCVKAHCMMSQAHSSCVCRRPTYSLRVNRLRISTAELQQRLQESGVECEASPFLPDDFLRVCPHEVSQGSVTCVVQACGSTCMPAPAAWVISSIWKLWCGSACAHGEVMQLHDGWLALPSDPPISVFCLDIALQRERAISTL